jgi:hypothetical protein
MNAPRVKLNLRPLQQVRQRIRQRQAIDAMYESWGRRVLAFWRDQFRRNRSGGGDWPPLKPETLKRTPQRIGILHVLGLILDALRPGHPANIFQLVRTGIAVGIGGGPKHPGSDHTIGEIANFHDKGAGNLPRRKLYYRPDAPLTKQMQDDARRMAERLLRESQNA